MKKLCMLLTAVVLTASLSGCVWWGPGWGGPGGGHGGGHGGGGGFHHGGPGR
ncbi:hypothetical protein COO59_00275 [Mixta theicola]|uniref:Lipoprotein n=1 Tax=Mixta theicola TaxID=1458355 RepID=A0A2K1QE44_9GAMM|nr:hypothetical protein [Mixta theicola]PNS13297.1 hypothetical protein COO59_00275 [Mixta theicola]